LSRDLQDKVIIVTGGSRGIGFAIVQAKFGDTITTRATVNDIDDDRRELHMLFVYSPAGRDGFLTVYARLANPAARGAGINLRLD
jgi:NAD(P)-dependent dehydrogenase (short-subunit alcohol dehydrogenase family)